jgi:hypothetical protein
MGKTLPPFSSLIEQERRRWTPFKKALPKADQPIFFRRIPEEQTETRMTSRVCAGTIPERTPCANSIRKGEGT